MSSKPRRFELGAHTETERRAREVQLLVNIAQPDPEYQPSLLTDEASLLDAVGTASEDIQRRLDAYFRQRFPFSLTLPIWQLVDAIRSQHADWPEDM